MKTQELKIVPPEGYEIDRENSSIDTIRFKPIKKKITYKDICRELFLDKPSFRFIDSGVVKYSHCTSSAVIHHNTISTSNKQLEQLLALNKLMNVAKYLNGDWEPNWYSSGETKWGISFNCSQKKIDISAWGTLKYGNVHFKSEELALQAIDILGEKEIKKALGIFE